MCIADLLIVPFELKKKKEKKEKEIWLEQEINSDFMLGRKV